jgi:putative hemolysin
LGPEALLAEAGRYSVVAAPADRLSATLREIGRLREIAFRQEGEGSGRAFDLDSFDRYYTHLILWNCEAREIVGAYRVCPTDKIVPRLGAGGLYTRTCFEYGEALLKHLTPALELGRSFVRTESQKSYSALALLWKGIGRMVARQPEYKILFGAVSISGRYTRESRECMRAFLEAHHGAPEMAQHVRPRNVPRLRGARVIKSSNGTSAPGDLDALAECVRALEGGGRDVPILLKHYLKLGARALAFGVDPKFGDCLDVLIRVDLTQTAPRTLEHFMGKAEAAAFLAWHRTGDAAGEVPAAASDKAQAKPHPRLTLGGLLAPSESA